MGYDCPDGAEISCNISEVTGESITVDFNHPLSGQDVHFEVDILEVE